MLFNNITKELAGEAQAPQRFRKLAVDADEDFAQDFVWHIDQTSAGRPSYRRTWRAGDHQGNSVSFHVDSCAAAKIKQARAYW
jgi:hypothetical protein